MLAPSCNAAGGANVICLENETSNAFRERILKNSNYDMLKKDALALQLLKRRFGRIFSFHRLEENKHSMLF